MNDVTVSRVETHNIGTTTSTQSSVFEVAKTGGLSYSADAVWVLVNHDAAKLPEGDISALCRIAGLQGATQTQGLGGGSQAAGGSSGSSRGVRLD